jgi:hypothetical protein
VSPWNPVVVIFPLVLFGTLCVLAAEGSVLSLLGATLLGSFVVQTNFATAPLVVVLLGLALIAAVMRQVRNRRSNPAEGLLGGGSPWVLAAGLVLLVLIWIPPLLQQLGNNPGNLTLIWRFFTAHHPTQSFSTGLWSVVAVDGSLGFGLAKELSPYVLGDPRHHAAIVLAVVLLVGAAAVAMGMRRRNRFAAGLGIASLIGFVVTVFSVTRIVGAVFGYLVIWEIAVPALFGTSDAGASTTPAGWHGLPAPALVALAALVTVILSVEMVHLPPLQRASDPDVTAAWHDVSAHLGPNDKPVYVGVQGTDLLGVFTFFGLTNELDARGYHPRVSSFWLNQVGSSRQSKGQEPVGIVLYPPNPSVESMPGYVGHTTYADIVISRPAPAA